MNKVLKIALWAVGIFVALIIVLLIGIQLFFPVEKAKALAIEKGSAALGRPITIQDVSVSFWGGLGVKLENVVVGNPVGFVGERFFTAENIDIKLRLLPLIMKEIKVDRFIINRPQITMLKQADGVNNFTFGAVDSALPSEEAKQLPAETKAAAAAVSLERLEIHGGQIKYRNDSSNINVLMENVEMASALQNPRTGVYVSSGRLDIDSLRISAGQPVPVVRAQLAYDATYDLNEKHIRIDRAAFNLNGIECDLTGDFYHETGRSHGKASLKAERILAENLLSFVPPQRAEMVNKFRVSGEFAVDLDVDFDAVRQPNPLIYSGSAVITNVLMARRDAIGELKLRRVVIDVKPDNLRANIQEGSFDGKPMKATVAVTDFRNPQVNGELSGYLNFVFLKPFLPTSGNQELDGEAKFDVKFFGKIKEPRNLDVSGDIDVEKGRYSAAFLPEPIDAFSFSASFDKNVVNVRNLTARSKSADISFKGRLDNLIPFVLADSIAADTIHPGVDGTVAGKIDLALAKRFLPAKRKPELSGVVNLNLAVSGSTGDLVNIRPRGTVSFDSVMYSDSLLPEPIRRFDAELRLSPDTIAVNRMNVKFVSSDASFFGTLSKPFPYLLPLRNLDRSKMAKPFFQFKLASTRFDCDKLFPEVTPGAGEAIARKPLDSLPSIIVPDVDGQGTFEFDTLIYDKIEFTQIKGKAKIYNRKIDAYEVNGKAYTGTVSGKTTVDLSDFENPKYVGAFQAMQIEADDFITRFTPFGGHLFGKMNFSGQYNAAGWEPDQFLNSLTLDGDGIMAEGKLVTSGALYSSINGLAEKVGQTFDKEQALKTLKSKVAIKDGKIWLQGLQTILGNVGDVDLAGFYGFDGRIGYTGTLLLSKEMTAGLLAKGGLLAGLAGALSDRSTQRIKVPITVSGTSAAPKVEVDFSNAGKGLQQNLNQKTDDLLKGILKKK
jgi:hypothetical protein